MVGVSSPGARPSRGGARRPAERAEAGGRRWQDQFPDATFAEVDGVAIRYEKTGSGPPVLLVHGIADSLAAFRFLAPLLAERYTVYALDVKGAGESERPWPADYSVRGMASFLARFLDAVGVRRAAVVGSSWGGVFALRLAMLHPERVAALVPVGTMAFRAPVNFEFSWRLMRLPGLRILAPYVVTKRQVERTFRRYMFRPDYPHARERLEQFWRNLRRENGARAFVAYFNGWTERELAATEATYGALAMPVLILWGERDAFFPVRQAEMLRGAIEHAELKVYPGGGHSIVEENAAEVAADLHAFLEGLSPWT